MVYKYQASTRDDEPVGPLFDDYADAEDYARARDLKVIEYQYRFDDSELVDDYTTDE